MRSKVLFTVLFSCLFFSEAPCWRKAVHSGKKHKVVVFTPLYLDSAFDKTTGEYKFGVQFPRFINPGLEFYEGIQMALDSMETENVPLDVVIEDTRSTSKTLEQQINTPEASDAGLYIGYVTPAEERTLAAAALKKNIPFINANLPNDAGISNNPSLVILNSTLKTHCEGIYHFLQRYYPITPVVVFQEKKYAGRSAEVLSHRLR